jgi:polyphosphate kinase 2 (PPK2 family)
MAPRNRVAFGFSAAGRPPVAATRALNTPEPAQSGYHKGVATLDRNSQTHARASALFNKKEEQQREGRKAMAEYEAAQHAMREKTAKLRALRLARDAAGKQVSKQASTPPARKRSAAGE